MTLWIVTAAIVALPLLLTAEAWVPLLARRAAAVRAWLALGGAGRAERRRSEATARDLLRTVLDEESWAMYRDLGFVRVWGRRPRAPAPSGRRPPSGVAYAYLLYPHAPYVVFLPQTTTLLGECQVRLAAVDPSEPLTATDDLLANWMALTGDESGVVASAHISTPGTTTSRRRVRRDLWRLREWERERAERLATAEGRAAGQAPVRRGRTAQ
ncbi:hypothetical protein SK069_02390 [Patulibacter brassicae]|jgi:hypothetical protein|uniref:Uncharacterized protein n=1 Tax=Patulibacter brassicae TaxID=1705717 RepID=A0ABU4VF51_9ACTN|nr:hypothetical protein [Patulibacter brassicae]MDX8150429.1 hypothetical protein [Patulibacter brassicae]